MTISKGRSVIHRGGFPRAQEAWVGVACGPPTYSARRGHRNPVSRGARTDEPSELYSEQTHIVRALFRAGSGACVVSGQRVGPPFKTNESAERHRHEWSFSLGVSDGGRLSAQVDMGHAAGTFGPVRSGEGEGGLCFSEASVVRLTTSTGKPPKGWRDKTACFSGT